MFFAEVLLDFEEVPRCRQHGELCHGYHRAACACAGTMGSSSGSCAVYRIVTTGARGTSSRLFWRERYVNSSRDAAEDTPRHLAERKCATPLTEALCVVRSAEALFRLRPHEVTVFNDIGTCDKHVARCDQP